MNQYPLRLWGRLALFSKTPKLHVDYFGIGFVSGEKLRYSAYPFGTRKKRPVQNDDHVNLLVKEARYRGFDCLQTKGTHSPRVALQAGVQLYVGVLHQNRQWRPAHEMKLEALATAPYFSLEECHKRHSKRFFKGLELANKLGGLRVNRAVQELHDFAVEQSVSVSTIVQDANKHLGLVLDELTLYKLRDTYIRSPNSFKQHSVDVRKDLNDQLLRKSYICGVVETHT